MKAYGVFAGGGVRGAALAGSLAAAQDLGVEFIGFGGVSAGALIALLAAANFSGHDLKNQMGGRLAPQRMLSDNGKSLGVLLDCLRAFRGSFLSPMQGIRRFPWTSWQAFRTLPILPRLWRMGGLYNGDLLRPELLELLREKHPGLGAIGAVTFDQLWELTKIDCKLMSADITKRRAVLHSRSVVEYGNDVVSAAISSMAYPLVFQPVFHPSGGILSDGGLASNIPAFLFGRERELTKFPLIVFSLEPTSPGRRGFNVVTMLEDIIRTGLEAGDAVFLDHVEGVHHVRVGTPAGIGTLKFNLDAGDIDALFNAGYTCASGSLSRFAPLRAAQAAGGELKKQLWATYGPPSLITPILEHAISVFEELTSAREVRVHVTLPTGRPGGSRIVVYHAGDRGSDTDMDLEINEHEGCSGLAIMHREPALLDLTDGTAPGALEAAKQARIPPDRKTMLSVPIFAWARGGQVAHRPVVGVLSIDTATSYPHTGWAKGRGDNTLTEDLLDQVIQLADILSKLLH